MHRAKPKDFDPNTVEKARRWLQSYRAKLGSPDNWDSPHPPHPPDDRITAQFLSMGDGAGGWPRLEALLYDLLAERRPPATSTRGSSPSPPSGSTASTRAC